MNELWDCLYNHFYESERVLEKYSWTPEELNEKDEDGRTPLHVAVSRGEGDVVIRLLALRADPNVGDNNGATPTWHAAHDLHFEMLSDLLGGGGRDVSNNDNLSLEWALENYCDDDGNDYSDLIKKCKALISEWRDKNAVEKVDEVDEEEEESGGQGDTKRRKVKDGATVIQAATQTSIARQ
jgi:ankyrin repeat protein